MIDKREVIDTATALSLNPHVIEKDYVLGWLLWGIYNHEALAESWIFKGIDVLVLAELEQHRTDLEGSWSAMLAHQLPALPPVETYWNELPAFFDWLEGGAAPEIPAAYAGVAGEELIRAPTLHLAISEAAQSHLEVIRFAASNRLQVELDYQGSRCRIEPYSLRRTSDGNIILHGHNIDKGEHRSYRVDRIQGARVTSETFVPRFAIELTPKGSYSIPMTTGRPSGSLRRFGDSNRTGDTQA